MVVSEVLRRCSTMFHTPKRNVMNFLSYTAFAHNDVVAAVYNARAFVSRGVAAMLAMLNSCAANVSVVNIDNGFGAGCVASVINRL